VKELRTTQRCVSLTKHAWYDRFEREFSFTWDVIVDRYTGCPRKLVFVDTLYWSGQKIQSFEEDKLACTYI